MDTTINNNQNLNDNNHQNKSECMICYKNYNSTDCIPKILGCGHSFCFNCIQRADGYGNYNIATYMQVRHNIKCFVCNNIYSCENLITNYSLINDNNITSNAKHCG